MNNEIYAKTIYVYNGKNYKDLKELRTELENRLGKILDESVSLRLPPKEALEILNGLISKRADVIEILSAFINLEIIDDSYILKKSIFEMDL